MDGGLQINIHPETELILQNISDAYVSLDSRWCFTYVNNNALKLMGKSSSELIGKTLWEVFPDTIGTLFETEYRKAMNERISSSFQTYYPSYDMWLNVRVYPHEGGIAIFYSEIIKESKLWHIITESEKWFRHIADNAPLMIWAAGTDKLRNYFNNEWYEFTGSTYEQEIGNGWTKNVHSDDIERVLRNFSDAFDMQESFRQEWRLRHKDGSYRWVSVIGKPIYGPGKVFLGYIGFCIDIHEQVVVNETLEKLIRERTMELINSLFQEKELNKMKSHFISMASHQFRTPLTAILSSAGLIDEYQGRNEPNQVFKHTERIKTSVKHLINLLDDFLSLEKLEQNQLSSETSLFNLYDLAWELVNEVENLLKKEQRISFSYKGNYVANSDKNMIYNILQNLLSNATKYSEKNIELQIHTDSENIQIVVADEGIGIPEEEQDKLFSKYFRASNVGSIKGTGLGLNIVHHYVNLLNGIITYTSKKNDGTTFTVQIPNTPVSAD